MKKQKILLSFFGFFLSGILLNVDSAQAQENAYRLKEVYQQARNSYPGLESKKEDIQSLAFDQKQINTQQLPQIHAQWQNTYGTFYGSSGSVFPLPGIFNVSAPGTSLLGGNAAFTSFGSILADWTFFSFGKFRKDNLAAQHRIEEAEKELSAAELNLQSVLTKLYIERLALQTKVGWVEQNVKRVQEISEITKSYTEAGLKPGADSALASSFYFKLKGDLEKWKGRLKANEEELKEFIPIPFSVDRASVTAFLSERPQIQIVDTNSFTHPYLDILEKRIDYFDALAESASRSALPSASLLGGLSSRGSDIESGNAHQDWSKSFQNLQNNYLVGLGIRWNLTEGYQNKLRQKKHQHQRQSAAADFQQRKMQLNAGVSALQKQMLYEFSRIESAERSVAQAESAFELYNSRYESGLIGLAELLQIQEILQQAEITRIETYQEVWDKARMHSELIGDFSNLFSIF